MDEESFIVKRSECRYCIDNIESSDIISGMYRLYMSLDKYKHITSFKQLKAQQTMEEVQRVADKYNINISKYEVFLRMDEDLLNIETGGYTGASFEQGEIDLFPLAFADEESLARTIFHEVHHQTQYTQFGFDHVTMNAGRYERLTVNAENDWWENRRWTK